MASFNALIGNLFESQAQTLVNTVNCVGVMGKGVAEQFKRRFPDMFQDYRRRAERNAVRLGEPYIYRDRSGVQIVNFPTKGHWRSPSRLADIERGLDYLAAHAAEWGITSMAMPPLGCGNGGLEWPEVGPLIYGKLHRLPVEIEVYAPYGTPRSELTEAFLAAPSQLSLDGKGRRQDPPRREWIVLMEVLRGLEAQPYAKPVGRTIFQKIGYVVTELNVPTGFQYGKGSYGPFSADVKLALHDFANRNWLTEQNLGRMIALRTTTEYAEKRHRYKQEIERYGPTIAKTVDLFSRIKNTEQAEEVLTVLFADRQLKQSKRRDNVAEEDLYDYILDWKKAWRSDEKRRAVATAIRNLVVLGWLDLRPSDSIAETA